MEICSYSHIEYHSQKMHNSHPSHCSLIIFNTCIRYHGILKVREEIKDELWNYRPNSPNAGELDVVLTTFSYFSSEKQDDRNFLRKFKFDYLIIDEVRHCFVSFSSISVYFFKLFLPFLTLFF